MNSTQAGQLKNKLQNYPEWDREKQIERNTIALKKLEKMRHTTMDMSDDESKAREDFFKEFQEIIDSYRPAGAKLYSD